MAVAFDWWTAKEELNFSMMYI